MAASQKKPPRYPKKVTHADKVRAAYDEWERLVLETHGDPAAPGRIARELGFSGSTAFRNVDGDRHARVMAEWREARDTGLIESGLTGIATAAGVCEETYVDDKGVTRMVDPQAALRARELQLKAGGAFEERTKVEITGELEVTNPDVAAAIDRFTALADAAIRSAARTREVPAARAALTGGES